MLLACAGISAAAVLAAGADTPTATPTVTATPTTVPAIIVVSLNHNRFNPLTGETVQVTGLRADHGQVTVTVYNAAGTLVRKVADRVDAASATPVWDGKNQQGQVVASGVYLVMVTGNKLHKRFRIVVLK
jgi:flagellar hook assembly protein FlgD